MTSPSWISEAVFYQIFPDRFANGNPALDPPNVLPWGAAPTLRGFQGGDFAGVTGHLDYLADLGVNALYFNPVFLSPSNHRYNTTDYFRFDPKLGSAGDFRQLLEAAHGRGMRLILDGVFNHCGRGFFAFSDELTRPKAELEGFLYESLYRHYRVVRMTTKARRFVRELFQAFLADQRQLPDEHRA